MLGATSQWVDEPGAGPVLAPGAVVLSCFPSVGLAATVAAHYIVQALKLPRIGLFDTPVAPPVAVVQAGQVHPPIRVYGRKDLAVVVSEFPPSIAAASPLSQAILEGAEGRRARLVLCLEGVVPHPLGSEEEEAEEKVWAVLARADAGLRKSFDGAGARPLEDGVIGGVSGAMLVQAIRRKVPVAVTLVSARATEGYPDHRAAATLIEALDRFLPELEIDTHPLRSQAEIIEKALREAMKRRPSEAEESAPAPGTATGMYQ